MADPRFELSAHFRLYEPAGHGEHEAYVVVRSAEPGYCKIVRLASEKPMAPGLVFGFDGRAWRLVSYNERGEVWIAEPVAQ